MKFEWRESNHQPYLYAEGEDHYDLGVAKGHGLRKQIEFGVGRCKAYLRRVGSSPQMAAIAEELIRHYRTAIPEEYQEELRGLSDGYAAESGLYIGPDEIALNSCLLEITSYFRSLEMEPPGAATVPAEGCTDFASVNPDGSVVHGQNYDASPAIVPGNSYVWQHVKGEQDLFMLHTGASIGWPIAKNEAGVAMTVSYVRSNVTADKMVPRAVLVRRAMQCETAAEAAAAMCDEKGRSPFSYNLIISDKKEAFGVQQTPFERRLQKAAPTLVQSNRYEYPDWQQYLLRKSYSKRRQLYAEQLMADWYKRFDGITDGDLLEIMADKPIICREKTISFFTRESFGIGNPADQPAGRVPF